MPILMLYVTVGDLVAYMPQIIKILRTHHAEDLSIPTWFLWTSTSVAQLIYYSYLGDIWLLISEGSCMLCNITIFILTLIYRDKRSKRNDIKGD